MVGSVVVTVMIAAAVGAVEAECVAEDSMADQGTRAHVLHEGALRHYSYKHTTFSLTFA